MSVKSNFGNFLKSLRLKAGFGLRKFADLVEIPASNLSAIEHNRRSVPNDKLTLVADALGLVKGTSDWNDFFDMGSAAERAPADVQKIVNKRFIPALLRTIDNVQLSDKDIQKLIEEIQGKDGSAQTKSR
ncbi:MAG: helix-turn-helix domain-containing protein [Sedimentisphaerales bacterium]